MQEIPLNGFYESTTLKNSARRCVNLIPINEPNGSLSTNMLECPSGLDLIADQTATSGSATQDYSSATAGVITSQSTTVSVSPNALATASAGDAVLVPYQTYAMFYRGDAGKPTKLDFADGFDYARIALSQDDIIICSPAYAAGVSSNGSYCEISYPGTSASAINVLSEFPLNPKFHDIVFAGGRIIWVSYDDTGSDRFRCYYSDIGATLPKATQFFSPDNSVSRLTGAHNLNGALWVFDADNAFLFTITSSASTPFQWQRSATLPIGCAGPHAKAEVKGSLFVLGRTESGSYSVVAIGSVRVSTPAVDYAINEKIKGLDSFDILRKVKLFGYRDKGRDILSVSVDDLTFCYNITDKRWFEMSSDGDRWSVTGYGTAYGQDLFVGSNVTVGGGLISFELSKPISSSGQEFGLTPDRFCETGPINANQQNIKVSELEPICSIDGDTDQSVYVAVSKDFGGTYGAERNSVVSSDSARTRFLNWGLFRQAVVIKLRFENAFPSKIIKLMSRIKSGGREQ